MFIPSIIIIAMVIFIYKLANESKKYEEELNEVDDVIYKKFDMSRDEFINTFNKNEPLDY